MKRGGGAASQIRACMSFAKEESERRRGTRAFPFVAGAGEHRNHQLRRRLKTFIQFLAFHRPEPLHDRPAGSSTCCHQHRPPDCCTVALHISPDRTLVSMPPSQEERRLHQPPSFTASLYDLAVPASSTASNAPFVDVLQQSRLNRMQDDSSALSSLISSVLGGGGGSGVGATAPTEVASLASPAPGKQAASSPARLSPSLQSPASAPVDALASAAAVRARAQAIASNNAAVSAYAVRLNPAPRDSHAAHCGEDVRNVLSVDSIAEAVLPPNSAASIAPTERPPHSDDRNLSRPATPAALIMLDQQLQQVLASSPAPDTHATRAAFSASSHIQRGQPEGNRRAERHIHESGMREENWIPVDYVEVQASRTAEGTSIVLYFLNIPHSRAHYHCFCFET